MRQHYTLLKHGSTMLHYAKLLTLCIALLSVMQMNAQVSSYSFTATTGTYTPLVGGTAVTAIQVDDALSAAITLPFTFTFNGTVYSAIKVSSNGFMTFNTAATSSSLTNDLDFGATTIRPLVAPLWDDTDGSTLYGGAASYQTSGVSPTRVFTFEWKNWQWNYSATSAAISYQVKLYEGTNIVEFIYQQEAGAVLSGSASIGISGQTTGVGNFLSLNSSGVAPTVSSVTETTSINTKPATGQVYRFSPPILCTGTPTPGTIPSTFTACYGAAAITPITVTGYTGGVSGITFQWEESNDNGVGDAWANAVGGTGATTAAYSFPALFSDIYYRCKVTCSASGLFDYTNSSAISVTASPLGDLISNPIVVPSLPATVSGDNLASNCFTNNYGQLSPDVYYQVVADCNGTLTASTCASLGTLNDTYLHILDAGGVSLGFNDDGCSLKSTVTVSVTAGSTYYIVAEGWSTNSGTFTLDISSTATYSIFYADVDGDAYGDALTSVSVCDGIAPSGYVGNFDDCNDADPAINPTATEVCNGVDDDCDGLTDDADPGVIGVSTWYADSDTDGFGDGAAATLACAPPTGYVDNADDCNDADILINPGVDEVCSNGVDDNCDGTVDEGSVTAVISPVGTVATCKGVPVTFSVEPCFDCTYQWFKNDNPIIGATSSFYSSDKPAYFNVQVNSPTGCFDLSDYTELNVNPAPNANISAPNGTSLCTTVKLKASYDGTYTWQWYKDGSPIPGANSYLYFATTPGSYNCLITNAFGCARTTSSLAVTSCREEVGAGAADVLSIYPNPTAESFTIDLQIANTVTEQATIRIYSLTGQVVYEKTVAVVNGNLFELITFENEISGGIYVVNIIAGNKEFNQNLVVNK